jgi:hypothetical protein
MLSLVGVLYGLVIGACCVGVSFVMMRQHTGADQAGLATLCAYCVGVGLGITSEIVVVALSSHEAAQPFTDTFATTTMLATLLGSPYGWLDSYGFIRTHPAHAEMTSRDGQTVVELTGLREGTREMITLAMSEREWRNLAAVREVVLRELRWRGAAIDPSRASPQPVSADDAVTVQKPHWRHWIHVTGRERDSGKKATITIPHAQWRNLPLLEQQISEAITPPATEPRIAAGG